MHRLHAQSPEPESTAECDSHRAVKVLRMRLWLELDYFMSRCAIGGIGILD